MKEIKCPSGAVLKITVGSFAESKALYQAVLEELKDIRFAAVTDFVETFKNIYCTGFSSKKVESCLEVCFKRCLYNGGSADLKIDKDTFEPVENRQDYSTVCIEVLKENISPFLKSLFVEFQQFMSKIPSVPA